MEAPFARLPRRADVDQERHVDAEVDGHAQRRFQPCPLDGGEVADEHGVLDAVAPLLGDLRRSPQAALVPDVVAEDEA